MSALAKVARYLEELAKNAGLLKYGTGDDRLARMIADNPHISLQSVADGPNNSLYNGEIIAGIQGVTPFNAPGLSRRSLDKLDKTPDWYTDNAGSEAVEKTGNPYYYTASMIGVPSPQTTVGPKVNKKVSELVYPMFGEIAKAEKTMILPEHTVTRRNQPNRSMQTASTELTSKDPVYIPHSDQMFYGDLVDFPSVDRYLGMSGPERAAYLLDAGTTQGRIQLSEALRRGSQGHFPTVDPDTVLAFAKKYGVDLRNSIDPEATSQMVRSANTLPAIEEIIKDLHKLELGNVGFGQGTLRKASILNALKEGRSNIDPALVKDALFCEGGLVKMSKAMRQVA